MINSDNLQYLPKPKFLRQKKILVLSDCPLAQEVQRKKPHTSQSLRGIFKELAKNGISHLQVQPHYLFYFRPEKGDLNALFKPPALSLEGYTHWEGKDSILSFAYTDLINLREDIADISPDLILCLGKWSLFFLTGETTVTETKKSAFGTLLKWRSSHLTLSKFWQYERPHIVLPLLPAQALFALPEYKEVVKQDMARLTILTQAVKKGTLAEYTEKFQNYQFIIEPNFATVKNFLSKELVNLRKGKDIYYSVDVETRDGFQDCLGIAVSSTECICIPFATINSPCYWKEVEEKIITGLLREFLTSPHCKQIGQNYAYDIQYIWQDLAIQTLPEVDTIILHHVLHTGMKKNLSFLCSLFAKYYRYWKDEGAYNKGVSDKEHWIYNCKDCCWTFEISQVLHDILLRSPKRLQTAYYTQLRETLPAVISIMRRGVRIDTPKKELLLQELSSLMGQLGQELDEIVGEPFNPKSSVQKQALFYDVCEMPVQYSPSTRRPTVNAGALSILSEKFPLIRPIASRIEEFGKLSTYTATFLKAKMDIDNRMRTNYSICGTTTFRLSSSQNVFGTGMNLQNVPAGGKTTSRGMELPNCRSLFIPDEGKTFFDIDLDSADLRIVIAISGATQLQQMLDEGYKPYVELMKEYYNDPSLTKESDKYIIFKSVTHASNYQGSAKGIALNLGLNVWEVEKLQRGYFKMNPEITRWHKELRKQVMSRGWIENIFGYRRYFFNLQEETLMQVASAWRPQSEVGLLINKGLVSLERAYQQGELPVEVLLQVHDSLAGQYPSNRTDCPDAIKSHCEIALPYTTPITIPVGIVTSTESWGGCK